METPSRLKVLGGDSEDLVEFSVLQVVISALIPLLDQLHLSAFNRRNKRQTGSRKSLLVFLLHRRTLTALVFVCGQSSEQTVGLQVQTKPLQLCSPVLSHLLPSRISVLQV